MAGENSKRVLAGNLEGALGRPFRRSSTVPALEGSSLRRLSQDSEGYVKTGRVVKEIKDQLIKP
jgi:hypothetical protein